ncbi:hypothetical protein C8J57DRAFT_1232245 [Mycena rebaudengoi]|nr:hypothetical protein C8J57DRAFT_1232245 [Mycena rebaudengoi]
MLIDPDDMSDESPTASLRHDNRMDVDDSEEPPPPETEILQYEAELWAMPQCDREATKKGDKTPSSPLSRNDLPKQCPAAICYDNLPKKPVMQILERCTTFKQHVVPLGLVHFVQLEICTAAARENRREHNRRLDTQQRWPTTPDFNDVLVKNADTKPPATAPPHFRKEGAKGDDKTLKLILLKTDLTPAILEKVKNVADYPSPKQKPRPQPKPKTKTTGKKKLNGPL